MITIRVADERARSTYPQIDSSRVWQVQIVYENGYVWCFQQSDFTVIAEDALASDIASRVVEALRVHQ